jgi:hypothetical protein
MFEPVIYKKECGNFEVLIRCPWRKEFTPSVELHPLDGTFPIFVRKQTEIGCGASDIIFRHCPYKDEVAAYGRPYR